VWDNPSDFTEEHADTVTWPCRSHSSQARRVECLFLERVPLVFCELSEQRPSCNPCLLVSFCFFLVLRLHALLLQRLFRVLTLAAAGMDDAMQVRGRIAPSTLRCGEVLCVSPSSDIAAFSRRTCAAFFRGWRDAHVSRCLPW
jgi:hypothetical protein